MEMKSFREQLESIRAQVAAAEKDREQRRVEERERVKDKLADELKQTPPDTLYRRLRELEEEHKSTSKRFYPVEPMRRCLEQLDGFEERIRRYQQYEKRFPEIYTDPMKRAIDQLGRGIRALRDAITPQWEQWQKADGTARATTFRSRQKTDDLKLVDVAKEFHTRAHGMQLDIPKSFFSTKHENFHVAESEGAIIGYFEYYPDEHRMSFAVKPATGTNFFKLVRAFIHRFCREGPLTPPLDVANVRIYSRQEVKFYTDMGFMKTETLGMSDWLYQAKVQ